MIRDITIGQYYHTQSVIHRLDPRVKLVGVLFFLVSLFLFDSFAGYIVVTLFLVCIKALSNVPIRYILKGLRPILILLIITSLFTLFFTDGDIVWELGLIHISAQGIRQSIFMAMRLIYLVLGSSILTYTTTPGALTDGIESLLKPLTLFHVPVQDFAVMMSLALRFIPILLEETNRIMDAQSARGADFTEGSLYRRMRGYMALIIPLFVSAMKRADDLALAMEARCYNSGVKRTKLHPLKYKKQDMAAYVIIASYVIAVIIVGKVVHI